MAQATLARYRLSCKDYGVEPRQDVERAISDASEAADHAFNFHRGHSVSPYGERLADVDAMPLFDSLADDTSITSLILCYNNISNMGAKGLAACLRVCTAGRNVAIKHVDLSHNDVGPAGASQIAESLEISNVILSSLSLNGNPIGRDGGMAFATALLKNGTLEHVDLGNCELEKDALTAICASLNYSLDESGTCAIRSLNLDNPRLTSLQGEVAAHLGRALRSNNTLVELSIAKHKWGNDASGVCSIVDGLAKNRTLQSLNMSGCNISQPGGPHIARMIRDSQTLTHIDLSHNKLSDEGIAHIAEVLRTNTALKSLNLASNCVGPRGMTTLGGAVAVNRGLERIRIWGNAFGPETNAVWGGLLTSGRAETLAADVVAYAVDGAYQLAEQAL